MDMCDCDCPACKLCVGGEPEWLKAYDQIFCRDEESAERVLALAIERDLVITMLKEVIDSIEVDFHHPAFLTFVRAQDMLDGFQAEAAE
jgi:hypothetical protein